MNDYNTVVKTLEIIRVFSCNIDMKTCYESFNDDEDENTEDFDPGSRNKQLLGSMM